ncbi:hypothetical protein GH714_035351 [Hevea brasiliensis]|uniref:Sulfite exporter TauE/SafE family protein n=1 Tax=Hevea brasiliensis TaxID=3981 RepID=A0A6A6NE90_HEVBR|nr:hypothetical protein GH714_035351 [Hevea brasiliensis]
MDMAAPKDQESTGLLLKILPPRLEDAGLEDCTLPLESIKEAFFKAASAIKSGTTSSFSDEEEDDCVQDRWQRPKTCLMRSSGLKIGDKKEENGGDADGDGDEEREEKKEMRFGWKIVLGSIIGFFGAACGRVGGVGGGGIFVPMLTLIIGFNAKSSTALSKCMVTGAVAATVYYNLKLRHPTLELPIIDYDLALLFQPMLVLGISLGVALNVIFADWTITILLIILFLVTSSMAFFKGVETWKKETKLKKEATRHLEFVEDATEGAEDNLPLEAPSLLFKRNPINQKNKVSIVENVYWKELGLLIAVWLIILGLQIGKIPVAVGVTAYEAVSLYKGQRKIASMGEASTNWRVHRLVSIVPLHLDVVSSATAAFAMTFSASMSVIEYYLLKRFPVPYALYFFAVSIVAAFIGQHVVRKLISILGRASIIIFILASTIFVSALLLGGVGIARMMEKIERKEYMGFENICSYGA